MVTTAPGTRAKALEVSLELFSAHGYDGTTLQQIADRLGVTKAALYYHFKSKDELLQALIEPALEGFEQLLAAYEVRRDSPGRRREFLDAYLDYLLEHRALMSYIARDLAILSHPVFAKRADDRRRRLERLLAGDDLDLPARIRVAVAFGGIQTAIVQHPEAEPTELRDVLREAATMLVRPRRRPHRPS